jgi:hypothetical protein
MKPQERVGKARQNPANRDVENDDDPSLVALQIVRFLDFIFLFMEE